MQELEKEAKDLLELNQNCACHIKDIQEENPYVQADCCIEETRLALAEAKNKGADEEKAFWSKKICRGCENRWEFSVLRGGEHKYPNSNDVLPCQAMALDHRYNTKK